MGTSGGLKHWYSHLQGAGVVSGGLVESAENYLHFLANSLLDFWLVLFAEEREANQT